MTREEQFEIGMAINKIAMSVSEEDFGKIKESLSLIEAGFVKLCDELKEAQNNA